MPSKNKKSPQKDTKNYIDLLYMTPLELQAKDISILLNDTPNIKLELWEEMNILELELNNQNTVDFEALAVSFKNPSDIAFVKNRNIKTIFVIQLCEEDLNTVAAIFETIIEKFSGFLCADSEDFQPVYAGSSNKGETL